jgi:hypothetical protein
MYLQFLGLLPLSITIATNLSPGSTNDACEKVPLVSLNFSNLSSVSLTLMKILWKLQDLYSQYRNQIVL